ncbi:hypothetical protein POVCU2_0001460 [Plasmodium ovale curtisi]|uniref:Uncharacterized protein n=1 Tax=Plasmodium ovale curtisi TaxID=864141 RepID=A0A1A8VHS1_PLAOA|nr:hypothetical protein POVCU2_0001460 [Plasmodium ovale curtisi]SBT00458.1 hypothetical protein POVCU1_060120 [Plasmodium ovale curtisi]
MHTRKIGTVNEHDKQMSAPMLQSQFFKNVEKIFVGIKMQIRGVVSSIVYFEIPVEGIGINSELKGAVKWYSNDGKPK